MKTLEELEKERNEAKSLLDSNEFELISIIKKIDGLKKVYNEHLKMYSIYQKDFINADSALNKSKKIL